MSFRIRAVRWWAEEAMRALLERDTAAWDTALSMAYFYTAHGPDVVDSLLELARGVVGFRAR